MDIDRLLMNIKRPQEDYPVGEGARRMQALIETHHLNDMPVIVGGSFYWVPHLLSKTDSRVMAP